MLNIFIVRLRRLAAVFALFICATVFSGCDVQMFTFTPFNSNAQKQHIVSAKPPVNSGAAVASSDTFCLGSGDRLGEASFAIYRRETLVADAQH